MGLGLPKVKVPNPVKVVKDAAGKVKDTVSDGVSKARDGIARVGDGLANIGSAVGDWFQDNWKTIAAIAVSTLVFAAVVGLAVLLPFAVPVLLTLAVAGFASGAAFYLVDQWLNGRPIDPKAALIQGGISALVTVGTAGVGRLAAPYLSRVATPWASRVLPQSTNTLVPGLVRQTATNTTVGAVFGGGTKLVENAITGRPLTEGLGSATVLGAVEGGLSSPADRFLSRPRPHGTAPTPDPVPTARTVDPVVAERGAGARDYGDMVGLGGVEPLSPITGTSRTNVDSWHQLVNGIRRDGPLVLTDDQLVALAPGRGGPSGTVRRGEAESFLDATRLVNEFVQDGRDLSLERIRAINRVLGDDRAGIYRHDLPADDPARYVAHANGQGGAFFYANPEHLPTYLDDFMQWYRANRDVLPPSELAAEAYQQLVRIHPFTNGNGRTTRLVMDWILQAHGLPPAVYDNGVSAMAVHETTDVVVYNADRAILRGNEVLTTTSDTTAVPGAVIAVPPSPGPAGGAPSRTKGILGAIGDR